MALFGRVHVNRFLKGNYFSRLNVINLNSPLVKSLPIINTEQAAIPISEGIPSQWHSSVLPLHTTKGTASRGAPGGPSTNLYLGEPCPHSLLEPPDTNQHIQSFAENHHIANGFPLKSLTEHLCLIPSARVWPSCRCCAAAYTWLHCACMWSTYGPHVSCAQTFCCRQACAILLKAFPSK